MRLINNEDAKNEDGEELVLGLEEVDRTLVDLLREHQHVLVVDLLTLDDDREADHGHKAKDREDERRKRGDKRVDRRR